MPELAPPLDRTSRQCARLEVIESLSREKSRLEAQLRMELAVLAREDTEFGFRKFLADVVALHLKESPQTADRWLQEAQVFAAHPVVVGRVMSGEWSDRHADALLDEVAGLGLSDEAQEAVVALVMSHPDARTPYQVRKAARAAVMVLDPAAARARFDKAKQDRSVGVDAGSDAVGRFWAQGTVSAVAALDAALTAQAGPKQPGDDRTMAQRKFDALMDLVCGRAEPVSWQAQLVVDVATVEGGDRPAEIPGLGLVCAEEARELVAQASLRRLVVDEQGQLLAVDAKEHRPDLAGQPPREQPRPLSAEVEPADDEECDDDLVSHADREWLAAQLTADEPADDEEVLDEQVRDLTSHLEIELRRFLDQHALARVGGAGCSEVPAFYEIYVEGRFHGTDEPPDDPGDPPDHPPALPDNPPHDEAHDPTGTPDPEESPSFEDRAWLAALQRHEIDPSLDWPEPTRIHEDTPGGPPPLPPALWSRTGLERTLRALVHAEVDDRPLASVGYRPSSPLGRFVKTRDQTCTFPGCRRHARDCELDHVRRYPEGTTCAANLAAECTHHHQAKHAVFAVTRTPDGTVHWTTPAGVTVARPPRPLLRGW